MKKAPLASKLGADPGKPLRSKENVIAPTHDLKKPAKKTKNPPKPDVSHATAESPDKGL